jgi:hypothetical protein
MSCERYKTVIVEAAAAGEIGPSLRVHLEGCAECRAAFTEEQSLFSAIDAGLSQRMNASPSPEFLPRIRSAIDSKHSDWPVPTSNAWFRWLPIAGVAAAACLALVFAVRHHSLMPEQHQPVTSAAAPGQTPAQVHARQAQPQPEAAARAIPASIKRSAKAELQVHPDRIERTPETLVPSEERVALAQFVTGLSRRREAVLALSRPTPFETETPPGGPLEIAKLEVPPLIPVKEE